MNIAEAAERLGVSRMTISYALNGTGRLNPETRRRLLAALEELGCTPNVHAQRLASGRTNVIVYDDRRPALFADLFARELLRNVQKAATLRNYSLLLNLASDAGDASLLNMARARAMDGVILVGYGAGNHDLIAQIVQSGCPCVALAKGPDDLDRAAWFTPDLNGEREAARHLVALGHRRIGFIDLAPRWSDARSQAIVNELRLHGAEPCIVHTPDDSEDGLRSGVRAAHTLLDQAPDITAILTRNDACAMGTLYAAWERGLRVPQDLSLIGHDDLPMARFTQPPLTTVQGHFEDIAEMAVAALQTMIETSETVPGGFVSSSLIVRDSTAPPRKESEK